MTLLPENALSDQLVPDQQLLSQAARGDEISFDELYNRYGRQVYNYLLRLLREELAAEDLLQEVFIGI